MPHVEIISEKSITISELKERLLEIKKRDKELTPRTNKVIDYLNQFSAQKTSKIKSLKEKMLALNIPRLKERHICKIIDIYPQDMDNLKILFAGESIQPKQEDLNRILTLLQEK